MKPARVVIMTVAVMAAGLAGYLAMTLTSPTVQVNEISSAPVIEKMPTIDVLVTTASLPVGARLGEETLEWKGWPEDGVVEGLIRRDARPDAIAELTGAVVRLPLFVGEPLRHDPSQPLDSGIIATHWMAVDDIETLGERLRSPLVLAAVRDYLVGPRLPLAALRNLQGL